MVGRELGVGLGRISPAGSSICAGLLGTLGRARLPDEDMIEVRENDHIFAEAIWGC